MEHSANSLESGLISRSIDYNRAMKISIIGGTGNMGRGLALRWARAGHDVIVGSRDEASAAGAAKRLNAKADLSTISGMGNVEAAAAAELVVLTVPYSNHRSILAMIRPHLHNKILIDTTAPLNPSKARTVKLPAEGSAGKAAQELLGDEIYTVSAFQTVAAAHLYDLDHTMDCDVLVCGNDPDARDVVVGLAADAGVRAWHGGRIDNAIVAEALTSALIFINHRYKIDGAGIRIVGEPGLVRDTDKPEN